MSATDFGQFVLTIAALLAAIHGLGYLAERVKQPRIVGEIVAGILLGPFVLKPLIPGAYTKLFSFSPHANTVIGFLSQLGLILLMFCSGSETRRLLARENRNMTMLLVTVSDLGSFLFVLAFGYFGFIPLARLTRPLGRPEATLLIVAIAVSVTSIPVISRIFWDLAIMRTRFASLLLGYAVLEDIALWIVLAFAMALAKSDSIAGQHLGSTVASHVASTFLYMAVAMAVMPQVLRWAGKARWNVLSQASQVGYIIFVLMGYCAAANLFDANLQFAALLAGYGIVGGIHGTERERLSSPIDAIAKVSFGGLFQSISVSSDTSSSSAGNSRSLFCWYSFLLRPPSHLLPKRWLHAWAVSAGLTLLTSPSPPTRAVGLVLSWPAWLTKPA